MGSRWMNAALLLLASLPGIVCTINLCAEYPLQDPCQPGGTFDPLLQRCSGYAGLACYQCYSGDLCKTEQDSLSCELFSTAGNPVYLSEYWLRRISGQEPCVSTPAHYRPEYQIRSYVNGSASNTVLYETEATIRKIHAQVGNAETEGYTIVVGVGATMVIYSAVSAIAERILDSCEGSGCPSTVDVFAQAPFYFGYISIVGQVPRARWNASADPSSPYTIEILTYPNNPTGEKRAPLVKDPTRVVRDMVYYWPMYSKIDEKHSEDIMIFSSSKHDGLAGTRFGWGLIRDSKLAQKMMTVVFAISLSTSVDIELRVLNSMKAILSEGVTKRGYLPFHEYGHDVISGRFQQLRSTLSVTNCSALKLTNDEVNTGAYAWIMCSSPSVDCQQLLSQVNLIGTSGVDCGASKQEVRLSMFLPTIEFDVLIKKVEHLCSNLLN